MRNFIKEKTLTIMDHVKGTVVVIPCPADPEYYLTTFHTDITDLSWMVSDTLLVSVSDKL